MKSPRLLGPYLGPGLALAAFGFGCQVSNSPTTVEQPGGSANSAGSVWFADVTEQSGIAFTHDPGPLPGEYFMPQIMGSGCALFDCDDDGRLDIYLVQNGGPGSQSTNRLLRQVGGGRFVDVSAGSGLDVAGHGMGVAVGDVNNDGRLDVCLTEYGRTRLFLNAGNGKFIDRTKEAGIDNPLWGTSACFVDYNRDGLLDLVVVNYVDYDPTRECGYRGGQRDYCHPNAFAGTVTKLYRNRGPGQAPQPGNASPTVVQFADVTVSAGLAAAPGPGLGVVCADFTGDRRPDICVANDSKPNHLWVNQTDGTFKEEAALRGVAYNGMGLAQAGMGVGLGDVDGNGLFDLFVTHLTEETHALWRQEPRGLFQDRTGAAGLAASHWRGTGFGTVLGDIDHDGGLDVAVVNGRVARGALDSRTPRAFAWDSYHERNQLFANTGTGRFRDISLENAGFCGTPMVGRGLACGDVDGDGGLDLLVNNVGGRVRLYRNVAPGRGHWLLARAVDPSLGGRDAYGAEITVHAGERRWLRLVNPGHSYLSSSDPRAHFGLGPVQRVDAIRVVWPDGTEEEFPGRPADQAVVLRKGEGRRVAEN